MIAPACKHEEKKRHGRDRKGHQRFRCTICGKTWTECRPRPLGNMRIPQDRAVFCLRLLLEGNSIRSVERLTGTHRDTICRLVALIGQRCEWFLEDTIRKLPASEVQADEIWGFVGCKEKTRQRMGYGKEFGDSYCFTAIERHTKLLLAWHLDKRTPFATQKFTRKLKRAVNGRFQLTTDAYGPYRMAITDTIRSAVDYAQLIKIFAKTKGNAAAVRYSPGDIIGTDIHRISGHPDKNKVCTSHIERHNLTIRTQVRRMTRLTNAFSKKWENHEAALALFFAYYNFCRVHSAIKTTPAVAAGLTDHVWNVRELLEAAAATQF